MKKIAIFTSTRAEYGLLKVLIGKLNNDKDFELILLVSASHFNPKYGNTLSEIEGDGFDPDYLIPVEINNSEIRGMANHTAETIKLVSKALEESNPHFLLILGDRFETFGSVTAAHLMGIKVIHLHGGETSLGAIDEKLRHAITQLSTYHFTSAEIHKKKVETIIGSSKNVYNVGPLVIDGLLNLKRVSKNEFKNKTGFNFSKTNLLVTFHPETLSQNYGIDGLKNLLKVLDNYDSNILFTAPNIDVGSDKILEIINKFVLTKKSKYFYIPSLGQELYLNALLLFDCVIGNSSSGILEAPLMKTKVLNIGNRQKGRFRFGPVLNASNDLISISSAVEKIFSLKNTIKFDFDAFKKEYGSKSPSNQIIKVLKKSRFN